MSSKPDVPFFSRLKVIALLCILCVGCVGFGVVVAQSSQSRVISAGVEAGAPDCTVWTNGAGEYYLKTAYGVFYEGTDADVIINLAIASGDSIYIKAGYYEIDAVLAIVAYDEEEYSYGKHIYGDTMSGDAYFTKNQDVVPDGTVIASESGYTGSIFSLGGNAASGLAVKNIEIDHLTLSGMPLPYTTETYADLDMVDQYAGIRARNLQDAHFHHLTIVNCFYGIYISTESSTNDGVELSHIWVAYNKYGILITGQTQVVSLHQIYSYLNFGRFLGVNAVRADLYDIFSNADDWELEALGAIKLTSNGFISVRGVFIQNCKDGARDGVRGITIEIGVVNATVMVTDAVIQGIKTGDGVKIVDSNKFGYVYLDKIMASPSDTSFLGGDGGIDYAGCLEDQNDGMYISVCNSVFYDCDEAGIMGDYTFISNVWNGTTYIQSYP